MSIRLIQKSGGGLLGTASAMIGIDDDALATLSWEWTYNYNGSITTRGSGILTRVVNALSWNADPQSWSYYSWYNEVLSLSIPQASPGVCWNFIISSAGVAFPWYGPVTQVMAHMPMTAGSLSPRGSYIVTYPEQYPSYFHNITIS